MQSTLIAGLIVLQLAAVTAGQAGQPISSHTEVWHYKRDTRDNSSSRKLVWQTGGTSLTHGFGLTYKLEIYQDSSTATAYTAQLGNGQVDTNSIQELITSFKSDLANALQTKITNMFPPGMMSVQVTNLQPGVPITADTTMFVSLKQTAGGSNLKPNIVMERTDTWMLNTLGGSTSQNGYLANLGSKFVGDYALGSITVTGSAENAGSIQQCKNYFLKHVSSSNSSTYRYIVGIVLPVVGLAVVGFRFYMARRNKRMAQNVQQSTANGGTAYDNTAQPVHALTVGPPTYTSSNNMQQLYSNTAAKDASGHGTDSSGMVQVYADADAAAANARPAQYTGDAMQPHTANAVPGGMGFDHYGACNTHMAAAGTGTYGVQETLGWQPGQEAGVQYVGQPIGYSVSDYTANNAVSIAGNGPIVRNQGVWSRMFGGPRVV